MANYNYAPIVVKVQRAIEKYGREITFIQRATDDAPANDPLAGPSETDIESDSVKCLFVPLTGMAQLGILTTKTDDFKQCAQVALLPPSAIDYAEQTFLVDADGTTWKLNALDMLKPGDTALLYYIGVTRP